MSKQKGVNMKIGFIVAVFAGTMLAQQQQPAPAPQAAANQAAPGQSQVASTLKVYAYPNKGQSHDQQFKDETECYNSAQVQAQPNAQDAQAAQQGQDSSNAGKGQGAKGAAKGAAGGAAIGAIAGDAGAGAGIGAVAGTMAGRRQKKKAEKEADQQQQQQQQAQQAQATDNVRRAYSACMEARNYTVK